MTAKEFLAREYAGLILQGRDGNGEYYWLGDSIQWREASLLEKQDDFPENHPRYPIKNF